MVLRLVTNNVVTVSAMHVNRDWHAIFDLVVRKQLVYKLKLLLQPFQPFVAIERRAATNPQLTQPRPFTNENTKGSRRDLRI